MHYNLKKIVRNQIYCNLTNRGKPLPMVSEGVFSLTAVTKVEFCPCYTKYKEKVHIDPQCSLKQPGTLLLLLDGMLVHRGSLPSILSGSSHNVPVHIYICFIHWMERSTVRVTKGIHGRVSIDTLDQHSINTWVDTDMLVNSQLIFNRPYHVFRRHLGR